MHFLHVLEAEVPGHRIMGSRTWFHWGHPWTGDPPPGILLWAFQGADLDICSMSRSHWVRAPSLPQCTSLEAPPEAQGLGFGGWPGRGAGLAGGPLQAP